jgi:hypothetical protein
MNQTPQAVKAILQKKGPAMFGGAKSNSVMTDGKDKLKIWPTQPHSRRLVGAAG